MGKKRVVLTPAQMDAAIALYLGGVSCRELARRHDTDKGVFTRALRARSIAQRDPGDRNRLYPFNHHAFDVIDSEQAAYWLGFIYADGCVHRRSLQFGVKALDADHLERFAEFLQSDCPVKMSTVTVAGNQHDVATLCITHSHLAQRLTALGIVKGRTNLDACASQIPPALLRHWIRGLFDGDGHVGARPHMSLIGSHELVALVHADLIAGASLNPSIRLSQHRCGMWYLIFGGYTQCLRVVDYLYHDASIWLPRKRERCESWQVPQRRQRDALGHLH